MIEPKFVQSDGEVSDERVLQIIRSFMEVLPAEHTYDKRKVILHGCYEHPATIVCDFCVAVSRALLALEPPNG